MGIIEGWQRAKLGCAGVALLVGGGFALMCGLMIAWRSVALTFDSVRLQGEVVRHEERAASDPSGPRQSPTYAPVVRITVDGGKTIEFTSEYSAARRQHAVGERVPVVYRPATGEAEIWSLTTLWLFPAAFAGGGAALLGAAVLALWAARR